MIKEISLSHLGPVESLDCTQLSNINLFIGHNGSGKTFLLKFLYASMKAIEQFRRGKEIRSLAELFSSKLYWTFQPKRIGDLVQKGEKELLFEIKTTENEVFGCSFGNATTKQISKVHSSFAKRGANSVFLPAKEILSLQSLIQESRSDKFNAFGFDDTYLDLANALKPTRKGKNIKVFSQARDTLGKKINGRIEYENGSKEWFFRDKNNKVFDISLTSEGVKKISILDVLLGNHYMSRESIIFIDEPESALHPELVSALMDIIAVLSKKGVQFFIATHSYFVIKKLYLIAHKREIHVPVFSFEECGVVQHDLMQVMPENPIIRESINLYKEELSL